MTSSDVPRSDDESRALRLQAIAAHERGDGAAERQALDGLALIERSDDNPPAVDLEAIRARADAATPGPWRLGGPAMTSEVWADRDSAGWDAFYVAQTTRRLNPATDQSEADAEFIAAARADVPALLAEVTRLTTELAEARKLLSDAADVMDADDRWEKRAEHAKHLFHQTLDRAVAAEAKIVRQRAVIAQVRELHKDLGTELGVKPWCGHCQVPWPCPTAAIVGAGTPTKPAEATG